MVKALATMDSTLSVLEKESGVGSAELIKMADKHAEKVLAIQTTVRESSEIIFSMMWDIGNDILKVILKDKKETPAMVTAYARLIKEEEQQIRRMISFARIYDKEKLVELAKAGLTIGHLEAVVAIADNKIRGEIEHKIEEEGASVKDTREMVKEVADKNPSALQPNSQKRRKEVESKKKNKKESSGKDSTRVIGGLTAIFQRIQEAAGELYMVLDTVSKNPADNKALIAEIKSLKVEGDRVKDLLGEISKKCEEVVGGE